MDMVGYVMYVFVCGIRIKSILNEYSISSPDEMRARNYLNNNINKSRKQK